MRRTARPKIKQEKHVAAEEQECDLTYYIHDRVELMHQVFSILKGKEMKAMAPECVRNLEVDDLQELCLEEVLGISSKRLCAIMDGAECPSDTNTSSTDSSSDSENGPGNSKRRQKKKYKRRSEELETISLDNISSDEIIIETVPKENSKRKKDKAHKSSKIPKKGNKADAKPSAVAGHKKLKLKQPDKSQAEKTKTKKAAERAGMTVLELLELQARARAIRAQLALEKTVNVKDEDIKLEVSTASNSEQTEDEVEIKEEPQEIVEIDSESDDNTSKLTAHENKNKTGKIHSNSRVIAESPSLTVQMPQKSTRPTTARKIKLVRNQAIVSASNSNAAQLSKPLETPKVNDKSDVQNVPSKINQKLSDTKKAADDETPKKITKKRNYRRRPSPTNPNDDHDELIMEVSDGEKLDLFEDSNDSSSDDESENPSDLTTTLSEPDPNDKSETVLLGGKNGVESKNATDISNENTTIEEARDSIITAETEEFKNKEGHVIEDKGIEATKSDSTVIEQTEDTRVEVEQAQIKELKKPNETSERNVSGQEDQIEAKGEKDARSDGELSDAPSSEVEVFEKAPEVLTISDDERANGNKRRKKKTKTKKSKEKKHKKRDKPDPMPDFRPDEDQNYFEGPKVKDSATGTAAGNSQLVGDCGVVDVDRKRNDGISEEDNASYEDRVDSSQRDGDETGNIDFDDVIEILEISDDSSSDDGAPGYPSTTRDILELGIKIEKQIESEDRLTKDGGQSADRESTQSWKERWLASSKVKKVMTTANILNALRKKNKELKRALVSEKTPEEKSVADERTPAKVEGSVEFFHTLTGCNKYADPIAENDAPDQGDDEAPLTMAKDAKHLLKMYKRLLKANGMYTKEDKRKIKADKRTLKQMARGDAEKPVELSSSGVEPASASSTSPSIAQSPMDLSRSTRAPTDDLT